MNGVEDGKSITVAASDGTPLHVTCRRAGPDATANVVLVHGWGEHHGRYAELSRVLSASGMNVWGYDQRGHGRSGGRRGHAPSFSHLVEDLARVVDRATDTAPAPLLLLGHSMGGLVVIRALQQDALRPLAACLSAPWLATAERIPGWKRALARVLGVVYPSLPIPNPLRPERLTRDEAMMRAHREDPLVHGRMTSRLFLEVEEAQRRTLDGQGPIQVPALFIVPGADPVVDAEATIHFVRRLGGSGARLLRVPGARHEPFNELDRYACFDEVGRFFTEVLEREDDPRRSRALNRAERARRGGEAPPTPVRSHSRNPETSPYRGTMVKRTPPNDERDAPVGEDEPAEAFDGDEALDPEDDALAADWDSEDRVATAGAQAPDESLTDMGDVDVLELMAERDQIRNQHLRLAADFDNYRKRTEGDLRARWDRAQAELVGKLLEPLDDLQRVAAWEPETTSVDAIVEGVDLVERKFHRVMADVGVEILDPVGERFDPNTMEAMMRVPAESEEDDERVERVFQKGCVLKGQLVRPARVSVYKAE